MKEIGLLSSQGSVNLSSFSFISVIKLAICMKNILILFFSLLLFGQNQLLAQKNYKVLLQAGTFIPMENGATFSESPVFDQNEIIQGRVYRVVQFYELPSAADHAALQAADIQLLSYLPHYAYIASLPAQVTKETLQRFDIRSIFKLRAIDKLDPRLQAEPYPDWAVSGDQVELSFAYYQDLNGAQLAQALAAKGYNVLAHEASLQIIDVLVPKQDVETLLTYPFVSYLEPVAPPALTENHNSRGSLGSHPLSNGLGLKGQYDGSGITIGLNDSRGIADHIDFKGRVLRNPSNTASHGTHVGGTVGSAGNLNPLHQGYAPKVDFYSYAANIWGSFPTVYTDFGVSITQTSLSNGCNIGYTNLTRTVDQQVRDYPALMHVFSAGNQNSSGCPGIAGGWYSITGGHKMGKNVIATANIRTSDFISSGSSIGPANDNRIKPDISAIGTSVTSTYPDNTYATISGTSMAAPAISGLIAQLQQAHAAMNFGEQADGGLIKAIVLNTAQDLGLEGPDFTYGWGKANGLRAAQLIEEGRHLTATITPNGSQTFNIDIPQGIDEARIMLYWTDFEGSTNAIKALVNNLDLTVADANGQLYMPWAPDPGPNATTAQIDVVAPKGVDTLNNVEQVTILQPKPGTYQVNVAGTEVATASQKFYIVYEFIKDEIRVLFPAGKESLIPQEDITIRWEALSDTGSFSIEYTLDNGRSWTSAGPAVPGSQRYFFWQTPNDVTGQARVRVSRGAQADESDANFTIIQAPSNIQFPRICQDFLTVTWDAVQGANAYDIFVLGEKFMDSVGTTNATFFEPPIRYQDENWISIRARGDSGIVGRRAIAVPTTPGTLSNCQALPPVAAMEIDTFLCTNERVSLRDISTKSPDLWGWNINPPLVAFADGTTPTSQNPVVVFTQPDTFTITLSVNNVAGANSVTKQVIVLPPPTAAFATTTIGNEVAFDNQSTHATGYRWYFGDGDSSDLASPTHTYAAPGDYTVTLKVFSPCGDITRVRTVQAWATGISDAFDGLQVALTPNPNDGKFKLNLSGELASSYQLQLINLQGQTILEEVIRTQGSQYSKAFDLSEQAAGLYFLRLSDGERVGTLKVVIE